MNEARILFVDDETDISEILKFNLENSGYRVDTASSAEEALTFDLSHYNLFLFDVMMEGMNGFELARRIRDGKVASSTPIIFVTAKDGEGDILKGFNAGADDYINKPFRIGEVIARVKAVLRRVQQPQREADDMLVVCGALSIDTSSKLAYIDGNDISLTKKEFEVLHLLIRKPGKVYSREEILARVWPDDVNVLERSIDVSVARLRKKLGRYASCIVSRSGYGYCFTKNDGE